jgi:hypothetical protein
MGSPRDALITALERFHEDDARERIARARGDEDADPREAVLARHAALRGPAARERFEEARERGLFEGEELAPAASARRDAYAAVGEARAEARLREVLARRVPHDSDHHAPIALFTRLLAEPHPGRRRAMARSLEGAPALHAAQRSGLADVEESLEGARWLPPAPIAKSGEAREVLRATKDLWTEALARLAHSSKAELETWSDLFFALRRPELGDPRAASRRWRRIAAELAPLGVAEALNKRARVERATRAALGSEVVSLLAPSLPHEVRVLPATIELGVASERDARIALGRAAALAWTHPALSPLARRQEGSVGPALGALFAHLCAEPRAPIAEGLSTGEARAVRELASALELFELRTAAASALAQEEGHASFAEAARELIIEAWGVDVAPAIAASVALRPGHPERLRALRLAPPLFVALRDQYDEDWWRNPRAAAPLRAACERGAALSIEAWAEELRARTTELASRLAERLA